MLPERHPDRINQRFLEPLRSLIASQYFTFKTSGLNAAMFPTDRPVIFVANHSGWLPLDALFISLALYDELGPDYLPYLIVHNLLVQIPLTQAFLRDFGIIRASWLHNVEKIPTELNPVLIFPEGAEGNCKPFWQAYQMKRWKSGFVRLAIQRQALVIPVLVLGGEESLPVARTLQVLETLVGSVAPLPLVMLPLPAAWRVIFLRPIDFSQYAPELVNDRDRCRQLAEEIGHKIQRRLERLTNRRPLAWLSSLFNP